MNILITMFAGLGALFFVLLIISCIIRIWEGGDTEKRLKEIQKSVYEIQGSIAALNTSKYNPITYVPYTSGVDTNLNCDRITCKDTAKSIN